MVAKMEDVKLLSVSISPFGVRCKIALAEKEVDYEYQEENLAEKSELLLRSNPVHKKIPVLLHNDKPICESLNIVEYIDEAFPKKASFFPSDHHARANARFWADFIDKKIIPLVGPLWRLKKGEELEEAKKEFIENLRTIEAELGNKKYFGGEDLGFVDITLVPFTSWFYGIEAFAGVEVEAECPKIAAWGKRCMERESVAKSLSDPKKVYEFISARRKILGLE